MNVECVSEAQLGRRERRQAGRLLAAEWGPAWRARGYAGPFPPEFRVLATNRSGFVTGHLSAFSIRTDPPRRLYGLGDLVVKRRYRGLGISARICERVVRACWERGAEVLLVDTVAASGTFRQLGFSAVEDFGYFYTTSRACHRARHWLVAERVARTRIELLEHGDF